VLLSLRLARERCLRGELLEGVLIHIAEIARVRLGEPVQ
jgi:hypothetical protein